MGKYLFYDVDGTLVGNSQRITERNKHALSEARARGHRVFLCTGRAYLSAFLGLDDLEVDGMITHAGGIVSVGEQILYEHDISLGLLHRMLHLFQTHHIEYTLESKDGNFHTLGIQQFYLKWIDEQFKDDDNAKAILKADKIGKNQYNTTDFDERKNPVHKVSFLAPKRADFEDIQDELSKYFHIHYFFGDSNYIDGELIPKDCTKAHGITKILEYYQADLADTVAFGDSMNDLPMISYVNTGIVHAQSPAELKKYSSAVFDDPDQDGIYNAMKKLNLI